MLQEIKMSRKEKIKFYREIKKKKLAEMLYECNRQLDLLLENRGNGYRSNPVDTGMSPSNGTNAEYNYIWFPNGQKNMTYTWSGHGNTTTNYTLTV